MDEAEKKTAEGAAQTTGAQSQSAQDDLKKVADRAKAATQGFDFNNLFVGRVDSMNYIYSVLIGIVVGAVLGMIPLVNLVAWIPLAVLGAGISARRFHDINITGWAAAALFIPVLGLLGVLYLCWKQGDTTSNQFGGVPDPKRDVFKAILNT